LSKNKKKNTVILRDLVDIFEHTKTNDYVREKMSSNISGNNIKREDVSIAYVAIVNDKDVPVLMKNYNYSQNEELNF